MTKEIKGKIYKLDEAKTFGASGFRKREVVIATDEQYSQLLIVEFIQDSCELLDSFKVEQEVSISINLRGREWINPEGEAKYFNSIQGWKIERISNDKEMSNVNELEKVDAIFLGNEPDDLPF